ncbi:hypothetical protein STXM2123_4283 [Streptomyces sp. F-3]|nr:hypothetical protein STXM2123_4283 [Streptomyces sp. F-3]
MPSFAGQADRANGGGKPDTAGVPQLRSVTAHRRGRPSATAEQRIERTGHGWMTEQLTSRPWHPPVVVSNSPVQEPE